jgi:hypothetical protein
MVRDWRTEILRWYSARRATDNILNAEAVQQPYTKGPGGSIPEARRLDSAKAVLTLITPVAVGDPRRYTGNWWQVLQEEALALREQEAREAAEREAKALENYHGPRWWKGERA